MSPPIISVAKRVERLREIMNKQNVQAYVVPSEDAHQSEYITQRDKRREYISGFSGSAGAAVITTTDCLLWTDGRYWLQAANQLDPSWKVMKDRVQGEPTIEEWIAKSMPANTTVGMDARLVSKRAFEKFESTCQTANQKVICTEHDLIDLVRESFKNDEPIPAYPSDPVFFLPEKYSGKSTTDKINDIRADLAKENADYLVVSALDEIAWLYNLRGSDISFNPVFMSYALVGRTTATLFIDERKVPADVRQNLPGVDIKPYDAIFGVLRELSDNKQRIWLDSRSSLAVYNCVSACNVVDRANPILLAKAIKNQVEVEGFRQCHIRDASALIKYLAWLENEIVVKNVTTHTEFTVAEHLETLRAALPDYISLSFDSISSIAGNGAIIHYKPEPETAKPISKAIYLIDSGGQYRDGTTDVTRTVHYGTPSAHEKDCYTRVLKGHIQLSILKFPPRIHGRDIDCIARMALWQVGLDYAHGTGHGVGSFLNVHEGPQGISYRAVANPTNLQAYMTITNEPGYYEAGNFGIRIENVMVSVPATTQFNNGSYLGFESVTVVPFEPDLINIDMLTADEIAFVNTYHQDVLKKVSPLLQNDQLALNWIQKKTLPISK
eukprot:gene4320-5046_t